MHIGLHYWRPLPRFNLHQNALDRNLSTDFGLILSPLTSPIDSTWALFTKPNRTDGNSDRSTDCQSNILQSANKLNAMPNRPKSRLACKIKLSFHGYPSSHCPWGLSALKGENVAQISQHQISICQKIPICSLPMC